MSMIVKLGSTRTGKILQTIEVDDTTNGGTGIHGDISSEIVIPLDNIADIHKAKLEKFLKTSERFMMVELPSNTINPILSAGIIEHYTPSKDNYNVSVKCIDIGEWMDNVPVLPIDKRGRISSAKETLTVTGTPAQIVGQVLTICTTETENYRFPQSIVQPVNSGGEVISHTFILSEVKTFKEFIDDLQASHSGFEVIFVPRYKAGFTDYIEWETIVGTPHVRKSLDPLAINIDQKGGGATSFSYTHNGKERANWTMVRSDTTVETDENWIDLTSLVNVAPTGDDEYLSVFKKEFLSASLSETQLRTYAESILDNANIELKTFTISIFDESFNFVHYVGRRLNVTATNSLLGLNEEMRVVSVTWNYNDPNLSVTVQPANLRVYPKLPNDLSDFIDKTTKKTNDKDKWKKPPTTPPGGPKIPGTKDPTTPTIDPNDDWDIPGKTPQVPPVKEITTVPSPITTSFDFSNNLSSLSGYITEYQGQTLEVTSPLWGTDFGGSAEYPLHRMGRGNAGPASSTTFPNKHRSNFYALGWDATVLASNQGVRLITPRLEIFQSRKFGGYPEPILNGNGSSHYTDANMKLSGVGGKVGEITYLDFNGQQLGNDGPGGLKFERIASGMFFTGPATQQKIVVYFHQLQIFDNVKTHIRSKGFAFEQGVNQTTGMLEGGWQVTGYPFEVAGSDKTFYPTVSQMDTHGPDDTRVTCVTPSGYFRDSELDVTFPFLVDRTFWTAIEQGKYAVDDSTITKNYQTGIIFRTEGMAIGNFHYLGESNPEKTWHESYQLLAVGDELWATNRSHSGYYSKVDWDDPRDNSGYSVGSYLMKYVMKSKVDKEGKPSKWENKGSFYGGTRSQIDWTWEEGWSVWNQELLLINDIIFTGLFNYNAGDDTKERLYVTLAGKVGADSVRLMEGKLPNRRSETFNIANNASGYTKGSVEWWPDFWDFKLWEEVSPNRAGDSNWYKTQEAGNIYPLWNTIADNNAGNENIYGVSSLKALTIGNVVVTPPVMGSYLLGTGGTGWNGSWRWYKI